MPDGNQQQEEKGTSGATEPFWEPTYKSDRYLEPDGTLLPVYDRVVTEGKFISGKFDPGEAADKRYWKKGGA